MKVFLSLIIFSVMLATCHGACFIDSFNIEFRDGKEVRPSTCHDSHDKTNHLIGSTWNTDQCLRCECTKNGMDCCHRFGGLAEVEGCSTVLNRETCKYEHYRLDDPSQPCHA